MIEKNNDHICFLNLNVKKYNSQAQTVVVLKHNFENIK